MAKSLSCPKCKNSIVIDQAATAAGSVTCRGCGSTFKLGKRSSESAPAKPAPQPVVPVAPIDNAFPSGVDQAPGGDGMGGFDFGSMNLDNLGGGAAGQAYDPLAANVDPLAGDPLGAQPAPASASMYGAPTVQTPVAAEKSGLSPKFAIFMVLGSIGGLMLIACGLIGFVFVRSFTGAKEDVKRMKFVAVGMLNYEATFKRFPTPIVKDSTGRSVYNWSVSLLPFIEPPPQLKNFDTSRQLPWDAAGNEVLRGPAPLVLRSARGSGKSDQRNVFLLYTPDKADPMAPVFREGMWTSFGMIVDGTQKTLLAIQLTRYSKPWAEPGELTIDEALELMRKEPGRVLVVFCDGTVTWIPSNIDPTQFKAMATAQAGDVW